ncbi:MAG: gfo/Idh/MocA family oxidoreductase [Acidobacteria bacterium]|nr:MAG: gfo/Idh/MocA family oxidoreductase [Acidobacteriota bacterium]
MELDRRRFLGCAAVMLGGSPGIRGQETAPAGGPGPQIGVIGLGRRGFELLKRLLKIPGANLSSACDVWGPHLDKVASLSVDPQRTGHFGKVLFASDAVLVAVPHHLHKPVCLMALGYERDIYLEMPVTHSLEEGAELIAAANKAKRIVQSGHQQILNPINPKVRELLKSGEIGQIRSITGEVHIDQPTRVGYTPVPAYSKLEDTPWHLFLGDVADHPYNPKHFFHWGLYWDYSCGLAGSEIVPMVAVIHTLTGATAPEKVTARGQILQWKELTEVPDHLSAILEYPEGFVARLSVATTGMYPPPSLVIHGSKGTIEYEPNLCKLYRNSGDPIEFRAEGDATALHLEAFLQAIKTRSTPAADLAFGINAANVGHLINLSAKLGKTVGWDKTAGKAIA